MNERNDMKLGEIQKGRGGFPYLQFDDHYGSWVRLAQDSIVLEKYCNNALQNPGTSALALCVKSQVSILDREMVRGLVEVMESWLATGDFRGLEV